MTYFGNLADWWVFPTLVKTKKKVRPRKQSDEKDYEERKLSFIERWLQREDEGRNTALWRGALFEIIRFYPHQTVWSATTKNVLKLLNSGEGDDAVTKLSKKSLAGTIGGGAALFFLFPFDLGFALLDDEMLLQGDWYMHILYGMKNTVEKDGIRSL